MFEYPPDSIPVVDIDSVSVLDTVSLFIRRDSMVQENIELHNFDASDTEIIPTDSLNTTFSPDLSTLTLSDDEPQPAFVGIEHSFPLIQSSIIFMTFMLCFMLFAGLVRKEGTLLMSNLKTLMNFANRRKTTYKDQITIAGIWSEFFLLSQTVLIMAIVLFVYLWDEGVDLLSAYDQLLVLGVSIGFVSLFILAKYMLYKIAGFMVPDLNTSEWSEKYLWIVELCGIVAFFPALLFVYIGEFRDVFQTLLIAVFVVSRLLILRILFDIFARNRIGFLYFIVYLCALETVPYFVAYKGAVFLVNYIGSIL